MIKFYNNYINLKNQNIELEYFKGIERYKTGM